MLRSTRIGNLAQKGPVEGALKTGRTDGRPDRDRALRRRRLSVGSLRLQMAPAGISLDPVESLLCWLSGCARLPGLRPRCGRFGRDAVHPVNRRARASKPYGRDRLTPGDDRGRTPHEFDRSPAAFGLASLYLFAHLI